MTTVKTYLVLVSLCLLSTLHSSLLSQTQEQMKEQAKSTLQRMTPEEIDRKVKELGMTREEAIRRAAELNINLEDYLLKPQTTTVAPGGVSTQVVAPTPSQTPIMEIATQGYFIFIRMFPLYPACVRAATPDRAP